MKAKLMGLAAMFVGLFATGGDEGGGWLRQLPTLQVISVIGGSR